MGLMYAGREPSGLPAGVFHGADTDTRRYEWCWSNILIAFVIRGVDNCVGRSLDVRSLFLRGGLR
jgi:hypothetical protein